MDSLRRLQRKAEQLGSFLIAGRHRLMEGAAAWLLAGVSEPRGTRRELERRAEQYFAVLAERWLNFEAGEEEEEEEERRSVCIPAVQLSLPAAL